MSSASLPGLEVLVGTDEALGDLYGHIERALLARGATVRRQRTPGTLSLDELSCDVLCINSRTPMPRNHFQCARNLRGVVFVSTGTDGCDLAAAKEFGVQVRTGSTQESITGMAEAVVALSLMLRLGLPWKTGLMREPTMRPPLLEMPAATLAGASVGFVGFGRIARAAASRFTSFGPRSLLAWSRRNRSDQPLGVQWVSLEDLFGTCDVVSVHVPLTADTRGMINETLLGKMKPSAALIVTSRGGVVDERSLAAGLTQGRPSLAAVDVFESEPPSANNPLIGCPGAFLTPHIAGHTASGFRSLAEAAVRNVEDICSPKLEQR